MTTFYLIRHASNDLVGQAIAGWLPGVHLNEHGHREAAHLADQLSAVTIHAIYSSPLDRARETAAPLAKTLGLTVQEAEAIGEIRFGAWTGKRIEELHSDPRWRAWNSFRTATRTPDGESMLDVQARVIGFMDRLHWELPGRTVALVSHGDPIRAALLFYLGMSVDLVHRLEVSPASLSIVELYDDAVRVLCINRLLLPPYRPA